MTPGVHICFSKSFEVLPPGKALHKKSRSGQFNINIFKFENYGNITSFLMERFFWKR